MPLQTETLSLQPQDGNAKSNCRGHEAASFDQDLSVQTEAFESPSACRGFLAGVMETAGLIWVIPGFWRVCVLIMLTGGGLSLPCQWASSFQTETWGLHNATSYSQWIQAGTNAISMICVPFFAMWSDRRPRKISLIIMSIATFLRGLPFFFEGWLLTPNESLNINIILLMLTAPFVMGGSGSPVFWAWATEVLPKEHLETGFSLVFALSYFMTWCSGTFVNHVVSTYELPPKDYFWIGQVFLVLQILVALSIPTLASASDSIEESEQDLDPLSQHTHWADSLLSPIRLVARKRSLRLICGMTAFITLPDNAVMGASSSILYQMVGATNTADRLSVSNWCLNFPTIFMVGFFAVVGVCGKRFGPARLLAVWTPITCVFFAAPGLLTLLNGKIWQVLFGLLLMSPMSLYPPLQSLVPLLVPSNRIGEALGAVAAFKNMASLVAPLVMGAVTTAMDVELYWTIFPACALVMLAGAWPFSILLARRVGNDTNMEWSVWSSCAIKSMNGSLLSR